MKERTRLFSIPPSVPFLETLVDALVEGTLVPGFRPLDDPHLLPSVTLYLPTRRSARLLPQVFQEKFGGTPVLLPAIRPVGDADEDLQSLAAQSDLEPLPPAMPLLERHLAMKYGVRSIPMLILFKDGEPMATQVGAAPKGKLSDWIKSAL